MMRQRFNVLNHISGRSRPDAGTDATRKACGRIPGNRTHSVCRTLSGAIPAQNDGYAAKGRELKQHVMAPLILTFVMRVNHWG